MAHRSKAPREKSRAPAVSQPGSGAWRRHAIPVLVLWVLAIAAYANSFPAGLVYDNHFILTQDPRIGQLTAENLHLILTRDYWYGFSISNLYRPLTTLSYLFNSAVLGQGAAPAGYHAINLALHLANITLVYLLGWLVLAEFWPAFVMAGIWAIHPVLTESVTNIVGRADLLAALGVLAGLLCYARAVPASGRRRVAWLLGVLASSAIAIFSKESGIVILAAIFLYDVAWCTSARARVRLPGYAAAAIPIAVFFAMRAQMLKGMPVLPLPATDNPLAAGDFLSARFTAVKVLGKYLWLLFWPARLSCDYSYHQIPLVSWKFASWDDWQAVLALAVLVAAGAIALWAFRRRRPLFFFIAFFFAAMAPTANIFLLIGTIMAERVLYLPAVGFAGCAAWAGWTLYRRYRPRWPALRTAARIALAIMCAALCARTFARNFDWYSEYTLWSSAASASPASYRAHQNLASTLSGSARKDYDGGVREAERAISLIEPLPDRDKAVATYVTAGFCYRRKGESAGDEAGTGWFRKALAVLREGERVNEAREAEFQRLNPRNGNGPPAGETHELHLELGRVYRDLGQYQDALDAFEADLESAPRAGSFDEVSKTYWAMRDARNAAVALLEGMAMNLPEQAGLAADLAALYRRSEFAACALAGGGLNFACPQVREELCLASRKAADLYRRMHRERDAAGMTAAATSNFGCPTEVFH